jgi:hypothetical protein
MSRGKKILLAVIVAVSSWFFGVHLIGIATVSDFTASGLVDMSDSSAVSRALSDPTFTTTYSWGNLTLTGIYWALLLPILFAIVATAILLIGLRISSRKNAT